MSVNNKLIDIEKLSRYHENLKNVLNTKEAAGEAAKAEAAAKKYADEEIAKLSFDEAGAAAAAAAQALADAKADAADKYQVKGDYEEAGAAAQALADAKADAANLYQVKGDYEEAGAAAQALADAKVYTNEEIAKLSFDEAGTAAGLNAAMDERVAKLEAIDHEKLATDASAAAVATVLDGAPEKFDTLKEVAEWISNNETASDAADLVTRVAALEAIDHEAYKDADETVLTDAKNYADGKFQEKGDYLTASDLGFATDSEIDALFA